MDYEGACGLYSDLESIEGLISEIKRKLNSSTLASDVASLDTLKTQHLKKLETNIAETKTKLNNLITGLKNIEECVKDGRDWV